MNALLYIIFILLGMAVGSFLNVVIDRLPGNQSLVKPASHCDSCGRKLAVLDLIPVFSFIFLRGRCRYCRERIPWRVLVVEAAGGLVFALSYWRFGAGIEPSNYAALFITAFWCCIFLVIIFIDMERKLIFNLVTYPSMIIALIILGIETLLPEAAILGERNFIPDTPILSGLIGGCTGFIFFFIVFIINPRGMGIGDIKLALLIGLVTGYPLVIPGLLIGIIIGGIAAIIILALKLKGRKDVIPYGVFLGIGPIISLFWGNEILDWYLGLF
jgi:leader peptidase (prepilin peptidase)/N-methyltransferase